VLENATTYPVVFLFLKKKDFHDEVLRKTKIRSGWPRMIA